MFYTFLTVCTRFQTMSTPLDTSYNFLTVCTWFQIMPTPLETSYTFLTVCTWFQSMSTPSDMSYTFLIVCTGSKPCLLPKRHPTFIKLIGGSLFLLNSYGFPLH